MDSIDLDAIRSLEDHKHDLRTCGDGVYRCLYCTLELRSIRSG